VVPHAALDDLRTAAFADAVAEYETLVDARNKAGEQVLGELQALATLHHATNLRMASLESEAADAARALDAARRELARNRVRAREEAAWAKVLESEVAGLRMESGGAAAVQALRAAVPVLELRFEAHDEPQVSILVT